MPRRRTGLANAVRLRADMARAPEDQTARPDGSGGAYPITLVEGRRVIGYRNVASAHIGWGPIPDGATDRSIFEYTDGVLRLIQEEKADNLGLVEEVLRCYCHADDAWLTFKLVVSPDGAMERDWKADAVEAAPEARLRSPDGSIWDLVGSGGVGAESLCLVSQSASLPLLGANGVVYDVTATNAGRLCYDPAANQAQTAPVFIEAGSLRITINTNERLCFNAV